MTTIFYYYNIIVLVVYRVPTSIVRFCTNKINVLEFEMNANICLEIWHVNLFKKVNLVFRQNERRTWHVIMSRTFISGNARSGVFTEFSRCVFLKKRWRSALSINCSELMDFRATKDLRTGKK